MPSPLDSIAMADQFLDRRCRLLDCQKEQMKRLSDTGYSSRELARIFHCSRRTVQFTIDPDKREANLAARAANGGSKKYYDKEKNTAAGKSYRKYKRELFINQ